MENIINNDNYEYTETLWDRDEFNRMVQEFNAPIMRRSYPAELLDMNCCPVIPLSEPVDIQFALRFLYDETMDTEASSILHKLFCRI